MITCIIIYLVSLLISIIVALTPVPAHLKETERKYLVFTWAVTILPLINTVLALTALRTWLRIEIRKIQSDIIVRKYSKAKTDYERQQLYNRFRRLSNK